MSRIAAEARNYGIAREQRECEARQMVALHLACGLDLHAALKQRGAVRTATIRRVRRAVERERLRGAAGHAEYSLDRHIAVSESLARLEAGMLPTMRNGARRRRLMQS